MDTIFFTVVDRGKANLVLRKAQECGAAGGIIFLGEGTIQSKLLEKVGLTETHKEILMIPASYDICAKLHEMISETFNFSKRNKGIAFSIPFKRWQLKEPVQEQAGTPMQEQVQEQAKASVHKKVEIPIKEQINLLKNYKYSLFCIMTIVDKGRGGDCMKAARTAGAKGGTLFHGRGAGIPTDFYFPLVIEPQKDVVMIITAKDKVVSIRDKITTELELEKAGQGIIFVLPVLKANGLFENRAEKLKGGMIS